MKGAGNAFKKNKKKQEERQTRPAGLDFVFDIGGRQVANRDLTAEDVSQMTQAQIEQIYANGIASVQRLQQDYDTLETFRNMGSLKPENSPYGLSFNKEEWLRQYVLITKLIKMDETTFERDGKSVTFKSISSEFPPFHKEPISNINMYDYVCGHSTWQMGAPIGYDKSGKDELDQANNYPELGKYAYKRGSQGVFTFLDSIFDCISQGKPIPENLYPCKYVEGNKIYIDPGILKTISMPEMIGRFKLDGLARNLAKGPEEWGTEFIPIDPLYRFLDLVLGEGNWFIAISEPKKVKAKLQGKNETEYWSCRGYYVDKLGTFRYGQNDITCKFGGNDEAKKGAVEQLMARTLIMSVFRAFKSTNKSETHKNEAYRIAAATRDLGIVYRQLRNDRIEDRKRMRHISEIEQDEHQKKRIMPAEDDLDLDVTKPLILSVDESVTEPVKGKGSVVIENASQHIGNVENPDIPKNVDPVPDIKEPFLEEERQKSQEHQADTHPEQPAMEPADEDVLADIEKYI